MQNDVTRNHKDSLFQLAFRDNKEAALSLYNAVNGSHHTDASQLKFELLDRGIFMRMENDNGFILDQVLGLYEHQSTMNPNMPLRGLFYFSSLYKKYVGDSLDIYSKKLVRLPTPQYIVFYNGMDELPDRMELRLSDAFMISAQKPNLECVATVMNINSGHNESIVGKCGKLFQYIQFHGKIREFRELGYAMEEAVEQAVSYCVEHDILRQILVENRSAFMDDILTTYDAEKHMELVARENYEEGFDEGFHDGQNKINRLASILLEKNLIDDLRRCTEDQDYQRELLVKYNIISEA